MMFYINSMILLVLTVLIFLGLVTATVLKTKQKVMILGGCVILLVLCNLANEIAAASNHSQRQPVTREALQTVSELSHSAITALTNETAEEALGELLQEEREMVGWVVKRWQAREDVMVHFENLHRSRLRLVIQLANHRINQTDPSRNIVAFHIDFKNQSCDSRCFRKTIGLVQKDAFTILLADNVKDSEQLTALEDIYEAGGTSIIFQNLPRFFGVHTVSRLTYRYPFSNNYLPKILEHHPSKTIEYCSLYRSFDYAFYSASLSLPLLQLCTRTPPLSPAVRCVRKFLSQEKMRVPESWVRGCLSEEGHEGLVMENGWVGVRKQHYWSGRANRTEITQQEDL